MEAIKVLSGSDLSIIPAKVTYLAYDVQMHDARRIAEFLNNMELTTDNVKEVKEILAASRRAVDALNRRRIDIKKEILAEYSVFESQVAEISGIISEAESVLRGQMKRLEEAERDEKRMDLSAIWHKRIGMYTFPEFIPSAFDRWLTPKMLNKSTSMKQAEKDMTQWMEDRQKDIDSLLQLGEQYVIEYVSCLDMSRAIQAVKDREATTKAVEQAVKATAEVQDDTAEETAVFVIKGKQNIRMVELLLTNNEIDFERK